MFYIHNKTRANSDPKKIILLLFLCSNSKTLPSPKGNFVFIFFKTLFEQSEKIGKHDLLFLYFFLNHSDKDPT